MFSLLLALACVQSDPVDTAKDGGDTAAESDADGDGYTTEQGDCDDDNALVSPVAPEICDNIDNNCDGTIDEGSLLAFYADADGDGYGDPGAVTEACEAPTGSIENADDCDDTEAEAFPGNPEVCDDIDNDCNGLVDDGVTQTYYADADRDGYGDAAASTESCYQPPDTATNGDDCDDTTASAYPGNGEVCDEVDNNCDGAVDEGVEHTYFVDLDGDGYGDDSVTDSACAVPTGYAELGGDCDDGSVLVNPGAVELCDARDNDCDGTTDEDDATDATTWYADVDADGYGNPDAAYAACAAPTGYVANDEDCDDADPSVNPDTTWYLDDDGDGYGDSGRSLTTCEPPADWILDSSDCDDGEASAYPGATEACDEIDNDCDGSVDESGSSGEVDWYADLDGDGYGDSGTAEVACEAPTDFVADDSDCDDDDALVNPGATEACNGIDDDCDGLVDDDDGAVSDPSTWYRDTDGDAYGDGATSTTACDVPIGYVADDTDCDDTDAAVNPAASEACNGVDDDCDGLTDADDPGASGVGTYYADDDGDGYGDGGVWAEDCSAPSGYVADATDCDDTDAAVSPAATETCDGVDNDCDGLVDDDDAAVSGTSTWYFDGDADGYGDGASTTDSCVMPADHVTNSSDCDDAEPAVNPAATEVCNGVDDDCDGLVDDDDSSVSGRSTYYDDADGDGYGDSSTGSAACSAPSGTVTDSTDCDDTDATVYPGATELYDGIDNDCDGTVDDGAYGVDCADILAAYPSSTNGTYTIDPDGSGGTSAFSVLCEMTIDGGGWTQAIQSYLDHLSTSDTRYYLYTETDGGTGWYMSPATSAVWSWSSYQPLNGYYSYATSGTTATSSFFCSHAESGDWGVGCSNGGGSTYKVLPIYYSTASSALSMICQDRPDAFSAGACQANARIWSRED